MRTLLPAVVSALAGGVTVVAGTGAGTAHAEDDWVSSVRTVDGRGDVQFANAGDRRSYNGVDIRTVRYSRVGDAVVVKVRIEDVTRETVRPLDTSVIAETNVLLRGRNAAGEVATTGVMLSDRTPWTIHGPGDPSWGITWAVDRAEDFAQVVVPLEWLRASLAARAESAHFEPVELKASVAWQIIGRDSGAQGVPDARAHDYTTLRTPYIDLVPPGTNDPSPGVE